MNLHLVLSENANEVVDAAIKGSFADQSYKIAPNQWVVAADMTDKALLEKLGASEGQQGRIMVATFSTYYGWHDKNLWSWLSIKEGQ